MYKYNLKVNGEYLIKGAALPRNAIVNGANVVRAGGSMSGLEIICAAKGAVTLAAGSEVAIHVLHSQDDETFIALPVQGLAAVSAGKTAFEDGEIIARLTLPYDCLPYVKANLGTNDAAAGGSFDLFLAYLPR